MICKMTLTKKQKNILLISGMVLLVVAVLGYWYWKKQQTKLSDDHGIEDGGGSRENISLGTRLS